jgi:hypothetical protein
VAALQAASRRFESFCAHKAFHFGRPFFVLGRFLCSSVQIDFDNVIENNAAYLAGWLKILQADSKFIFKAAAEAQKAADYILGWGAAKPNF